MLFHPTIYEARHKETLNYMALACMRMKESLNIPKYGGSSCVFTSETSLDRLCTCSNLVGVSLASGSGIITKEDNIESVCYEIRLAVGTTRLLQQSEEEVVETQNREHRWYLKDFEMGGLKDFIFRQN